jgi:uncharacterized protein YaaQ
VKLVVAVVQAKDVDVLMGSLSDRGFQATQINSTGGFLRESNVTLLMGVQESYVAEVMRIIGETSQARTRFVNPLMPIVEPAEFYVPNPVEVQVGGATVFVLGVERYERVA